MSLRMRTRAFVAVVPLLVVLACGGTTTESSGDAGGADGSADGSHADGASLGDAGTDAKRPPQLLDGGACPSSLEPFKGCSAPSDCNLGIIPSCCGMQQFIGVSNATHADYLSCYPNPDCTGLGCASSSLCTAEDGKTADCGFGLGVLGVTCAAGRCVSFVVPDGGADGGDGG